MAAIENLEYIDLADFTPGIWQRYASAGPATDGAAQVDGTYRCYGDPHGGLFPLPARASTITGDLGLAASPNVGYATVASALVSPVASADLRDDTVDIDDHLYVLVEYYDAAWDRTFAFVRVLGSGAKETIFDLESHLTTNEALRHFGYGSLDTSRYNQSDPQYPGHPIIIGTYDGSGSADGAGFYYPRFTVVGDAPATYEDLAGLVGLECQFVMGHQGRAVMATTISIDGEDAYLEPDRRVLGAEELHYTDVRDPVNGFYTAGLQPVEENASGYASWVSMNSNELFLVKQRGGGAIIRGDLARPTIVRMPGVASGHGVSCLGAVTPLGYIYGTAEGVWAWNGSDTCEFLSMHLEPKFWVCDGMDDWLAPQPRANFGYAYPWVFAGNDWMMDTRTGAWWRLEELGGALSPHHIFEVGLNGQVYGLHPMRDLDDDALGHRYDFIDGDLATSFQWHSQPIARTRNKRLDFREINVVLQGTGTVTVTLEGVGVTDTTATFEVDSPSKPVAMSKGVRCSAHDVEVVIASDGGEGEAPSVFRVSLGYRESVHIPGTS